VAVRKETIKQQVREALGAMLEPGETEQASVNTIAGSSPWLAQGLLGLIGQALVKYYYVVVTERRILYITMSRMSGRPGELAMADPRSSVSVAEYKPSALWSVLKLKRPDGKILRLNVHRIWKDELEGVARALGATPSA
jgi:hypothetical protein